MSAAKAIIFDCFGVIITDALLAICNALRERDPAAADRVGDIIKANNRGLINPDESNRLIAAEIGISLESFQRQKYGGEVKDQTLLDYIANLRSRYKTAMLSNVGSGSLDRRFLPQELERCFDQIVVSGEIGYAKPDPRAYQITASRLGVDTAECIFVDDREPYCDGARATGMQAICYVDFNQFRRDLENL